MVNNERLLDEFLTMVKTDSPSRQERAMADMLTEQLLDLGAEVYEDKAGEKIGANAGNIIAYFRGNKVGVPVVGLSAHMDCVVPCCGVKPIIEDGVIKTDGTTILGGDDKAGIAAIMEALRVLREQNISHGDIQVMFMISEEGGLAGSKNMNPQDIKADYIFVFDSGGVPGEAIITAAPGQDKIDVVIRGKTAHAGVRPEAGINAIVLASKAMADMPLGRIDEETTANVGIISGGVATNIVPDLVDIKAEARSRNAGKLAAQSELMKKIFCEVAAANGGSAEVKVEREYNAYSYQEDAAIVQLALRAGRKLGLDARTKAGGGGSDSNHFNAYGKQAIVCGVGMANVHTKEEYLRLSDLYQAPRYVLAIIEEVASL